MTVARIGGDDDRLPGRSTGNARDARAVAAPGVGSCSRRRNARPTTGAPGPLVESRSDSTHRRSAGGRRSSWFGEPVRSRYGNANGTDTWLASVFVGEQYRRRGIGAELVRRIMAEAGKLEVPLLYLYTVHSEQFYAALGWMLQERTSYREQNVVIMTYTP